MTFSISWLAWGGLVVLLGILAGFAFSSADPARPRGPHLVGTTLVTLAQTGPDAERGARALPLRLFYPAKAPTSERVPLMDARVARAFAQFNSLPSIGGQGAPSEAFSEAPPQRHERFPVVIFLHGAFSFADQNFTTLADLASHGFIVIALSHPGESVLSIYPDGVVRPVDPELENAMALLKQSGGKTSETFRAALEALVGAASRDAAAAASCELGERYKEMFAPLGVSLLELLEARREHLRRVLSALSSEEVRAPGGPFELLGASLDVSRIGLLGHSLGGYAALSLVESERLPYPVVSLDVPYFSLTGEKPRPLPGPLLSLEAEGTKLPGGAVAKTAGSVAALIDPHGAGDTQLELEVRGTSHMNFTDMNALPRLVRWLGLLGPIDGAQAALILNTATTGFFQQHLRNESGGWLHELKESAPEVRPIKPRW